MKLKVHSKQEAREYHIEKSIRRAQRREIPVNLQVSVHSVEKKKPVSTSASAWIHSAEKVRNKQPLIR